MQLQIPELQLSLQEHVPGTTYYVTGVIVVVTLIWIWRSSDSPNLDKIPVAGSNTWLGSWWAGVKFLINPADVVQEGYDKYKGTPFKISTPDRWMVILSGRQHVDELRRFRDDEFSFLEAVGDTLKTEHTLGHDTRYNPYHIAVIRSRLNRSLRALYADMKDEIVTAFDDILGLEGHEWKSVPALSAVQQVVSRTNNRVFFGLPLCRNPDWVNLNIQFTLDVVKGAAIINLFPNFMAPLVARFMTNVPGSIRRGAKHLSPMIEARQKHLEEYGTSWGDMPNDLLSWLMECSEGSRHDVNNITSRGLAINFAAIHTSSISFTQALFNLAANPQYIQPLREEVESIIQDEGWTKAAVEKMHKIDSFTKESQRMDGVALLNMVRKAMKDVTFSDGTVIPKGTFVAMATQPMHHDNQFYEDPEIFDPFRFAKMRTTDNSGIKHRFSTTSSEYLAFGYGRHACPGRFLAASMVNTMLAHLVVSYDVKLEDNATLPRNWRIGISITANPTARVVLRRRVA